MKDSRKSLFFTLSRMGVKSEIWDRVFDSEASGFSGKTLEQYLDHIALSAKQKAKFHDLWSDEKFRAEELKTALDSSLNIVTLQDAAYPPALKDLINPPSVIYTRGQFQPFDELAVAIVGPRASTNYGRNNTAKLAEILSPFATVVSGLALGIDSTAHQKTIDANGRTIGVAGCGLSVDYPQGNRALREKIPDHGVLISLWPPLMSAGRHHFPERNGIIAGLCQITIVVEASEKSGSLITARLAGEAGRDIAAVPGDITRRNSKGANQLIADGAFVLTSPEDILFLLEKYAKQSLKITSGDGVSETESDFPPLWNSICARLRHEPMTMDELMLELETDHDRGSVSQAILEMEISGVIKQIPGGKYEAA